MATERPLPGSTVRRDGNASSAYALPAAARPGSRGRWVRLSRARLVAVEAAAGAAVGGAVLRGPLGWTVLVLPGPTLLVAVTRPHPPSLTPPPPPPLRSPPPPLA